jgi:hypothetical protein
MDGLAAAVCHFIIKDIIEVGKRVIQVGVLFCEQE